MKQFWIEIVIHWPTKSQKTKQKEKYFENKWIFFYFEVWGLRKFLIMDAIKVYTRRIINELKIANEQFADVEIVQSNGHNG